MNSRERVLKLFKGEPIDRVPCFSGMGNVTEEGINKLGYKFAGIHLDAKMMADTAATTYKLFGFECGVVPVDLCVEAEAMGCVINVYPNAEGILYPTIKEKLIHKEDEMDISLPSDMANKGRVPLLREAIKLIKADIGNEVAIGSYVLGPFTLAGQIMELNDLLKLSFKKADKVAKLLDVMADAIIIVAKEYEKAGADFITVREMGATSDVLSPRVFKNLILPPLQKIIKEIKAYSVLHICGKTNDIVTFMAEACPTAISVEQKNDVAETRKKLGKDTLIFGNYDPYNVLVSGDENLVRTTMRKCIDDGVSAIWPGCDIWPTVPPQNMIAMMDETKNYGGKR
ncbi:MAG: methyltransferase [Alphaproteobacteria bacterium]|uniref:Methyltransferase n=1 Tax=Candidatus Nitrobium versatile TaxID=2884831 RepID=A0A953J2V4_9BACT|nr:methyltransferase [Candidatus Nitrobium versatile]